VPEDQSADHNARARRYRAAREWAGNALAGVPAVDRGEQWFLVPRPVMASLIEQLDGYEDGITWQTTCLNCARLINDLYAKDAELGQLKGKGA
jgi:hypothetical protein